MKNNILFFSLFFIASISWGQGLRTQGQLIVNESGEEVLLRGYGPGGWQIMEGYMMQTSGFAGSQHEIKERLVDLMEKPIRKPFIQNGEKIILHNAMSIR